MDGKTKEVTKMQGVLMNFCEKVKRGRSRFIRETVPQPVITVERNTFFFVQLFVQPQLAEATDTILRYVMPLRMSEKNNKKCKRKL